MHVERISVDISPQGELSENFALWLSLDNICLDTTKIPNVSSRCS